MKRKVLVFALCFFGIINLYGKDYKTEVTESLQNGNFEQCITLLEEWEKADPENLEMRDKEEVRKYIQTILYGESKSEFQGTPNEWLEKEVVIKSNIVFDSLYGETHMHVMEDSDGNVYVWSTASKSLEENKTYTIRMKVKEHKEYKGVKQTVVYYCKVK